MQDLSLKAGSNFLADSKRSMTNELTQEQRDELAVVIAGYDDVGTENDVDGVFDIDIGESDDPWPKHLALGRISEYPVSKDMFDHWVAYILVNTILFSQLKK